MTNYNERLDDVLSAVYLAGTENGLSRRLTDAEEIMQRKKAFINGNPASYEAKQLITSLIKELIEQAKPPYSPVIANPDTTEEAIAKSIATYGNKQIDRYKTNLKDLLK